MTQRKKTPKGAAAQRRDYAHDKLKAKVILLERFCVEGVPAGVSVPKSMNQLRAWVDPALGVELIGSSGTTNRIKAPHNVDLINRCEEALRALANGGPSHGDGTRPAGRRPRISKDQQIKNLRSTIAKLELRVRSLASDWSMARQETMNLQVKYDALHRKLAKRANS